MLEARALTKKYHVRSESGAGRLLVAVDGVSLVLQPGRTVGLVGESGSGKSTLGRMLAGLERPDGGELLFESQPLRGASTEFRSRFRRAVQVIFQNPMNALNPRWTVRAILEEPFAVHARALSSSVSAAIGRLLEDVRLPQNFLTRRPHELSGGERQRVCIARALALKPKIVICDEAVSSLDVLVRAEILNLLLDLQKEHGIGYLFISHDLAVVRHMSDTLVVMRGGQAVEQGSTTQVLTNPREPYTQELLSASQLESGF